MASWTIKEVTRFAGEEKFYDANGKLLGKAKDFINNDLLEIYASQCLYWQDHDDQSLWVECPICGFRYVNLYKHMQKKHPEADTSNITMEIQKPRKHVCKKCGNAYTLHKRAYRNRCRKGSRLDLCDSCLKGYNATQTCLERYGVKNAQQVPEIKSKTIETLQLRYGVTNPYQIKEVKERSKQTSLERYGIEYAIASKEAQKKSRETCKEHYGTEYPMQSKEVQETIVKRREEKYGCKYLFGSDYMISKVDYRESHKKGIKTLQKKYGPEVDNAFKIPEVKAKSRATCLRLYGSENAFLSKVLHGKLLQNGFSNAEIAFISKFMSVLKLKETDCQYHAHYDESFIKNLKYLPDFIYKNRYVIEFYGDLWHANPKFYSKEQIMPYSNKPAKRVWMFDKIRKRYYEANGFKFMVVWENDWKIDPANEIERIKSFLEL